MSLIIIEEVMPDFKIENGELKKCVLAPGETEVAIPEGVTSIGENAFEDCISLT
jgi:hypothetical protein